MPRDLVVGNGRLLVCMDRHLFARDLYWPRVGLYNHLSGRPIRFGVWCDGQFSWVDDTWDRDLRYKADCPVTECRLTSPRLGISLTVSDCVDPDADVFIREVTVTDRSGREREARLFLAPDTVLCETDIGDTAYYDPFGDAVVHYKRDNYLLFSGTSDGGVGLKDWACGMKGVSGMEGTWKDAEDGELSNNPIAQGSVDSCLSLQVAVPAGGTSAPAYLWIIAGSTREAVLNLCADLRTEGPSAIRGRVETRGQVWVESAIQRAGIGPELALLPPRVQRLYRRSLLIIQTQCDRDGAILAANDTDIMRSNKAHYSYMWPRDGALIAHALDGAGCHDLARQFFRFCVRILPGDRPAFMQKYGPDGSVGALWHSFIAPNGKPEVPIQEDETALVVWALAAHLAHTEIDDEARELYQRLALPCARFLVNFRDQTTGLPLPSWDLWEERRGIHTFTVCAVIAGLRAAVQMAERFEDRDNARDLSAAAESTQKALETYLYSADEHRFMRRLEIRADGATGFDRILDASLHALHLFDILPPDDPRVVETLRKVDERLWVQAGIGGLARYEGDYYARVSNDLKAVPGNPWILCGLWKAEWQIAAATSRSDLQEPADVLSWADLCALPAGILPEQIHPYNFTATTVAPLTWSHSEFVETVNRWCRRWRELPEEGIIP